MEERKKKSKDRIRIVNGNKAKRLVEIIKKAV